MGDWSLKREDSNEIKFRFVASKLIKCSEKPKCANYTVFRLKVSVGQMALTILVLVALWIGKARYCHACCCSFRKM